MLFFIPHSLTSSTKMVDCSLAFYLHGEYLANPHKMSPVWKQPTLQNNFSHADRQSFPSKPCVLLLMLPERPERPLQTHRNDFSFMPLLPRVQEEGWSCGSQTLGCQHVCLLFLVVTNFSCDFGRVVKLLHPSKWLFAIQHNNSILPFNGNIFGKI